MDKKTLFSVIILYILLTQVFEFTEANGAKKIAKTVLKAGVMKSAMGTKYHKPHMGRKLFPTWAIVLLVLGSSSLVGMAIFLYCLWKSRRLQTCWPTSV